MEFPEWAKSGEFERLDEILRKSTIKALAVITNAHIIKDKISFFYRVLKKRIYVINHQPSQSIAQFTNIDKTSSEKIKKYITSHKSIFFIPLCIYPTKIINM